MTDTEPSLSDGGVLSNKNVGAFLAARRKAVAAFLSVAGLLGTSDLGLPPHTRLIVQSIIGVLAVYGVHEVPNA